MGQFDLDKFVRELMDAAFDDEAMNAVMGALARQGFGSAHGLEFDRLPGADVDLSTFSDFDPELGQEAVALEPEDNPGLGAVAASVPGKPFQLGSFLDLKSLSADGPTRRLFDPHDWDKVLLSRLQGVKGGLSHLTLFRSRGQAEFTSEDEALLAKLAPMISSAMRLRSMRLGVQRREDAVRQMAGLGRGVEGMIFLSPKLNVLDADEGASRLLEADQGLRLRAGRLASTSNRRGEDTAALEAYLCSVDAAGPPLRIRLADERVMRLTAFRVGPAALPLMGMQVGSTICLCVETQPKPTPVDMQSFALAFDLTKAELRLLEALIAAPSAAEAARRLGVSPNTAKTHLSNIFRKTETETQIQLMLLLGAYR